MAEPWHNGWRWSAGLVAAVILAFAPLNSARASYGHHHHRHLLHHHRRPMHRVSPVPMYHAALLEDADSGEILYSRNAALEWPPASMAKMMLLLVTERQLQHGRISLEDPVRISERAAATEGSRLGLREGQIYPLRELMKAALIRSANDAAVAIAEKVGGSVEAAVRLMNAQAQTLGMEHTYYGTVDGLPPVAGHDVDYTTTLDLAKLARVIIHSTPLLQWSSRQETPFAGGVEMLHNTNHLIGHFAGCDGLKTGFTFHAGFNLTATAKRGNLRLVSVILGAPSNSERFIQSARLLTWGFDNFQRVVVLKRGEPLPVHVQLRSGGTIQPVAGSNISVLLPKGSIPNLKLKFDVPPVINGPVVNGESVGEVTVLDDGEVMTVVNAVCPAGGAAGLLKTVSSAGAADRERGSTLEHPSKGQSAAARGGVPIAIDSPSLGSRGAQ